ncbi:MAG: transketolase-like TK C-terminal-containing protein [Janthinobacterium lividum]
MKVGAPLPDTQDTWSVGQQEPPDARAWQPDDDHAASDLAAALRTAIEADHEERTPVAAESVAPAGPRIDGAPGGGMEVAASVLWNRFLRFDAADPRWPDRDRFVLSSGRFLPLLRALLRLTGHEAVGHGCGHGQHPAIETAVGPPGQGFATAVGMAMAERALAGRFGRTLVDHRTWVLACETDLAAGVSLEAASLAGQMHLDKLVVLFDARPSNAGSGQPGTGSGPEAMTRFAACGWAVRRVDSADPAAIAAAIAGAMRVRRPTLIACHPGPPSPAVPLPLQPDLADAWHDCGTRGGNVRRGWLRRLARHRLRDEFERAAAGRLPAGWQSAWRQAWLHAAGRKTGARLAGSKSTLETGRQGLAVLCGLLPEMVTLHSSAGAGIVDALPDAARATEFTERPARHLACGVQEHGMAALVNGLSLHGGLRPVLGASFVSIDRMRPALRLAALMGQAVIYLLTDDGLALGEDGAAWQPVEQLASLRAMPDVAVFRPADAAEVVACWELALQHGNGPSLIALCPRALPDAQADHAGSRIGCARGGYVLAAASGPRRATLIATGPEVAVALAAQVLLEKQGIPVAVVSLPCWELFSEQAASYRADILGKAPRIGIEAASGFGWERWLGDDGVFIGMDGFGATASADTLYRHFGITPEAVTARVCRRLGITSH